MKVKVDRQYVSTGRGGGGKVDAYTKAETDELLAGKVDTSVFGKKWTASNIYKSTLFTSEEIPAGNIIKVKASSHRDGKNIALHVRDASGKIIYRFEVTGSAVVAGEVHEFAPYLLPDNYSYMNEPGYSYLDVEVEVVGGVLPLELLGGLNKKVDKTGLKTVNGNSLLGEGDIVIQGGGSKVDAYTKAESDAKYAKLNDATQSIKADNVHAKSVVFEGGNLVTDDDGNLRYEGDRLLVEGDAYTRDESDTLLAGKASLEDGVLATGQEPRVVLSFVPNPIVPIRSGMYWLATEKRVARINNGDIVWSAEPSTNVIYCNKDLNTMHRWDGKSMVAIGGFDPDEWTGEELYLNSTKDTTIAEAIAGKVDKSAIVQSTGDSTTAVMSQDAVTRALASAGGGEVWEKVYDESHEANTDVDINIGLVSQIKKVMVYVSTTYTAGGTGNGAFGIYGSTFGQTDGFVNLTLAGSLSASNIFVADAAYTDHPIVAKCVGNNKSIGANWQSAFISRENTAMIGTSYYRLKFLGTQLTNSCAIKIWIVKR